MNEWLPLALAMMWGVLLGACYFSLLWFTVRGLPRRLNPQGRLLGSLLLRMLLLGGGFYLIMHGGHWERALAALAGFVAVRMLTLGIVERQIAIPGGGNGRSHDH